MAEALNISPDYLSQLFSREEGIPLSESIASINVAVIWVPLIIAVIGLICLLMFDLDKHHDKVVEDSAAGRWAGSQD